MPGALDGLLVISVEQAVAAPYCAARLADAGARVIKIERAEGDFARHYDKAVKGESAYFVWLNRGKQSVVMDFKDAGDAALLQRLIAKADVLIQNLAPGAAQRAGFGSAAMRQKHPRLITVDISGYGESGPYRDRRAYDLLVQAESGIAAVTGTPEAPGRIGVSATDIGCGMFAHAAVLEALIERGRSGQGRAIKVSLFSAMAEWMTIPILFRQYADIEWPRVGLTHPNISPYRPFATSDGVQTLFAIQSDREFRRLCATVLGRPEWADHPDYATNMARNANRVALEASISEILARISAPQLTALLDRAEIAYARVSTVSDMAVHPQLQRSAIATEQGVDVSVPALAADFDERPAHMGRVPKLGQHTEQIRKEFGA